MLRLKIIPALLIAFTATIVFSACSKSNEQGRYVPADAAIVVHINAASISEKLPWDEVKQNELFTMLYQDTAITAAAKTALDNPENAGIDSKKDMLMFMQKDSLGTYIAFEGSIKDAAKFKTYNTSVLKDATASEKDGINFIGNKRTTVSWDKEKFVIVTDLPEASQLQDMGKMMMEDSLTLPQDMPTANLNRDGIATATSIYKLDEKNSMAKSERFSELVGTKGDVHFYMNVEKLNSGNPAMAALAMLNINKLIEGSMALATVNFDNGQINVDIKSYAGKEMTELWKKYGGSKLNSDMAKKLPAKDVAFFFAMNFKPEGIKAFAQLAGIEGLINMGSTFLGFNLDDFVKANKGDIMLAVSDISKDSIGKPDMNFLFSASVGDKASFDKLIAAGNKMGKEDAAIASRVFTNGNNQYFAIGNNKQNVDNFITKESNSSLDFMSKIASSPTVGAYVNMQYLMNSFKDEAAKDSLANIAMNASLKMWDNIILTGGEFKSGGVTQHIEVNLVDKSTNSLKQLNKYMGIIGSVAKEKSKEDKKMWDMNPADVEVETIEH